MKGENKTTSTCLAVLCIFCLVIIFVKPVSGQQTIAEQEEVYYSIKDVPIPEGIQLEVGGLAFNDKGQLGVSTRKGEIWLIDQPNSMTPTFTRFAQGLHEPLGLNWKGESFYATQRGELTKMTDTNNDGRANTFDCVTTFPLDGNYHEYTYGPKFLPNGDMLVTLNLGWIGKGASLSKWRGWVVKVSPQGELTPIASGMRSPAGFGFNAAGDLFYTENQGDWVGSGRMTHVESGDFVGNPAGLKWTSEPNSPLTLKESDIDDTKGLTLYEYSKINTSIKPPSVWFPHTLMGISTSDIAVIPDNYGPFAGQLLVGDQGHSKIMRVFQEKVNGVYQGICFPFKEGFESGILRFEWGADNSLYVGMTSRGWASTGKESFGLERLVWNEKSPFEMKTVKATPDGFEIEFTEPVHQKIAEDPSSYGLTDFTYKYHHTYGSPPIEKEKRSISKVQLQADGKTVRIYLDKLRNGFIYEIKADKIQNNTGQLLLHDRGYYTLNEIPAGSHHAHDGHYATSTGKNIEIISPKHPTKMPASWNNSFDQNVVLGTEPGMKYDIKIFEVKANSKIKLVFNNNDDMLHNLLIVNPGKATAIGNVAGQLGLDGEEMGYVPESDEVLYHTNLLQPHTSDAIYFVAPKKKGRYEYVCTFPGHHMVMRGVMVVN